jgi:hypothetical protein
MYMDSFRILAYGGNKYAERVRVGRWPTIECGVMSDRYAARDGAISFGVGLTGGHPFLILRQIQDSHQRGGYPYTVLLDPGREGWERIGWNGALLARNLLADTEMAEIILHRVEEWNEMAMAAFVNGLGRAIEEADNGDDAPLLNRLWLGVQSRDTPLIVSSKELFDGVIEPADLASCLARLPACFRVGNGWLIGGGMVQAKAYGSMLVFDPDIHKQTPSISSVIGDGDALWAAWKELRKSWHCGPALDVISSIPSYEWPFPVDRILAAVYSSQTAIIHEAARQLADGGAILSEVGSSYASWRNVMSGGDRHDQLENAKNSQLLQKERLAMKPRFVKRALTANIAQTKRG